MPANQETAAQHEEPELLDLDAHMAHTSAETPQPSCSSRSSESDVNAETVPAFAEFNTSDSDSETDETAPVPDIEALVYEGDESSPTDRSRNMSVNDDPQLIQRRERNRKAALECRERQKNKTKSLEEEVAALKQEGSQLQIQIRQRKAEITKMKGNFTRHVPYCPLLQKRLQKRVAATTSLRRQASGTFVPAL